MTLTSFLFLSILGGFTGLGQIHDSLWCCTFLGFAGLLYYLDTLPFPKKLLHEALRPMCFMTGYFCVSLYWVSTALFIEIEKFLRATIRLLSFCAMGLIIPVHKYFRTRFFLLNKPEIYLFSDQT